LLTAPPSPPPPTPQAAYINLELSGEEKEKGNAAFKEQR